MQRWSSGIKGESEPPRPSPLIAPASSVHGCFSQSHRAVPALPEVVWERGVMYSYLHQGAAVTALAVGRGSDAMPIVYAGDETGVVRSRGPTSEGAPETPRTLREKP